MTHQEQAILTRLQELLEARVAPLAQRIDQEPEAASAALQLLGEAGLLVLARPVCFGGTALGLEASLRAKALIARYSGALAFLQTQHESAAATIAAGDNATLQSKALPAMGVGERLVGIGYSQLRRPGPPMLRARTFEDVVQLDGVVPWVTGVGYFGEALVAGVMEEGEVCFALVPLSAEAPGVSFGEPMRLAAMEVTRTVELRLDGHRVPRAHVARVVAPGWMAERDRISVARKAFFALGVARGAVNRLSELATRRDDATIQRAHEALARELDALEARVLELACAEEPQPGEAEARGDAIALAARAAHAAVVASGGAANLMGDPAQRLYREALAFSVLGQNQAVRSATLEALIGG